MVNTMPKSQCDWDKKSKDAIEKLQTHELFDILKYYDSTANMIKGRAWTITAWILTLDIGLFAFSHLLYVEHSPLPGFLILQGVVAVVGLALSSFTFVLLNDHANHLCYYWTVENKVAAWHDASPGLIFEPKERAKIAEGKYEPDVIAGFIRRLKQLNWLFVFGFIANFSVITLLHARIL